MPPSLRRRGLLAALGALAAGPLPALARPASLADAVDQAFRPLLQAHDIPGLAVGVVHPGGRDFFFHGVGARDGGRPVSGDTLFELGSLSKAYTATLAAWALAQGRLALDDAVERHVPPLRGSALGRASLLQLGTYSAGGLPLQFPDAVATTADALDWLRRFVPSAAPGAVRQYSNPSIGLFGHAAAAALGGTFAGLCEGQLYPRLGLRHTFLQVPDAARPDYAWGHDRAGRQVHVNPGAFDAQAYGVKATAPDLLRFVQAQLQPQGLEPAVRRAIAATHVGHAAAGPLVQGLGWEQYPWPVDLPQLQAGNAATMALDPHPVRTTDPGAAPRGPILFNKTGSTNGFGAYAAFVPARGIGLVMLANRNIPNAARIAASHAVLAWLDGTVRG